jgi:DNA segregation ATPase FtsK/SpoIIIE, S-DNA-T family
MPPPEPQREYRHVGTGVDEIMRQILEYQADQIEMVLHTHRVPGRVSGGVVTPRWVQYQVLPELGAKISRIASLSEEIALRLGATGVRVKRRGPTVQVEVPRADGQIVRYLPLCQQLADIPRQTAVLGLDEAGLPLLLRLPSPDVGHVLVAGTTGSGKTALARAMALSLAMYNRLGEIQLIMIDPKGTGFGPLADLPHLLRPVVRETHQAIFLLGELVEEMVRRDREGISEPRVAIFIDELADLMDATQGSKAMQRLLTRLTQRGRSAGFHVVACTQKPLVSSIGSLVKSNFPVRLVGSVASAEDAKVAAGLPGTSAELLLGRGDFLLIAKGQTNRFQAAYVSEREIEQVISRLNAGGRRSRRWLDRDEVAAGTGTEGRPVLRGKIGLGSTRARLREVFGHQLRLIK